MYVCLSEHRENVCVSVCLSEHLLSVRTDRLTDDMKWYILTILQVLYLPPPKGEEKAAGGGLFASIIKIDTNNYQIPMEIFFY